jgi:hypothetical protein
MFRTIALLLVVCVLSVSATSVALAMAEKKADLEIPAKEMPEPGENGKATVVNEPANLLSLELRGSWTIDLEVMGRMYPDAKSAGGKFELTFTENAEQSKRILANIEKAMPALQGDERGERFAADFREAVRRIYQTGELVMIERDETMTFAYALISWRGNPHLLLLEKEDDFESAHIMLARDPKGDNDILFMGGDQTKESFAPMKRKK